MSACASQWKQAQAAGTTAGETWPQFLAQCKTQQSSAAAAVVGLDRPPRRPRPPRLRRPSPARCSRGGSPPLPPRPRRPRRPAPASSAPRPRRAIAARPTRSSGSTRSRSIYHYQGTRYYGHTKKGAYMCEADAKASGARAARSISASAIRAERSGLKPERPVRSAAMPMTVKAIQSTTLDLKGLNCPLPALRTRKALEACRPGRCWSSNAPIRWPRSTCPTAPSRTATRSKAGATRWRRAELPHPPEGRVTERAGTSRLAAIVFDRDERAGPAADRLLCGRGARAAFGSPVSCRSAPSDGSARCTTCRCATSSPARRCRSCRILAPRRPAAGSIPPPSPSPPACSTARSRPAPDLLVVNRFGRLESEGGGMLAEIGQAFADGVRGPRSACRGATSPVWNAFADGLDVQLPPSARGDRALVGIASRAPPQRRRRLS